METRLGSLFRSWWQQIKQHPYTTGVVVVLGLILFIFLADRFGWDWTGLNSGTSQITLTSNSKINYSASIPQPSKTLWDWLQLLAVLAIPVVVGLGATWYTAQEGKVSDRENTDNQREAALQTYIDKMSELLLHEKLRDSEEEDEVRKVARVRTLTVLPHLDKERKRSVLQFLYESSLISKDKRIIKLSSADFKEANLRWMHLENADLRGVLFTDGVDLRQAHLDGADLRGAYFRGSDLSAASLRGANLSDTHFNNSKLVQSDFSGAVLCAALFQHASLREAHVTSEQLNTALSLESAIMPDGSIHP